MDRVVAFRSTCDTNRVIHLTTTQTSSLPTYTSSQTISSACTMSSSFAASSGTSSATSQALPVPLPPATTSHAGTVENAVPQHPLQPMLKNIMEELRKINMELKNIKEEQKKMNKTLEQMSAASFAIETSPYKVSYPWTRINPYVIVYVCIRKNFAFN